MHALRRSKLRHLIDTRFGGSNQLFLQKARMSKGRLSQLLDPKFPFGDVAAQRLIDRLGLPAGYFDSMDPATLRWAVSFDALPPHLKLQWQSLVELLGAPPQDPPAAPNGDSRPETKPR